MTVNINELAEQVERHEDELFRYDPSRPGLSMRLHRIEQLLQVMLKFGGAIGGLAIAWKAIGVLGDIIGHRAAGG